MAGLVSNRRLQGGVQQWRRLRRRGLGFVQGCSVGVEQFDAQEAENSAKFVQSASHRAAAFGISIDLPAPIQVSQICARSEEIRIGPALDQPIGDLSGFDLGDGFQPSRRLQAMMMKCVEYGGGAGEKDDQGDDQHRQPPGSALERPGFRRAVSVTLQQAVKQSRGNGHV